MIADLRMQASLPAQRRQCHTGCRWHVAALALALMSIPLFARDAIAQNATDIPVAEEGVQPEISRDGWRERVQEAKRRAREVALERRYYPELHAAPPEDPERIATERVLNDESLQRGDIVSTNKGLFVFRGRSDQPHTDSDFIPLPPLRSR